MTPVMTPFPQSTPAPRRMSFPKTGEVCADGAGGDPCRPESYPPLPDFEMSEVSPATDGRPWRKACPECLFRRHDPQGVEDSYQSIVRYSHPRPPRR